MHVYILRVRETYDEAAKEKAYAEFESKHDDKGHLIFDAFYEQLCIHGCADCEVGISEYAVPINGVRDRAPF